MTRAAQLDIEHLRGWIGRSDEARDVLTDRLVRGLLATIAIDANESWDSAEVPLAMHWCLAPPIAPMAGLGPDGHPARGGFLPPTTLPRRMWAGGRLEFHERLKPGDIVTRRSVIRDVAAKQGRSGTLCFVTVDHEITTARGLAIRERQDIVYRDAEPPRSGEAQAGGAATPPWPTKPPEAQWHLVVPCSPVLLFRYSALTFNGHRIHYDQPYSRDEENYPGLVVHGPLQATLLVEFAASLRDGRSPRTFDFRGVSPLFDGADFTLNASDADGDSLRLWTADVHGRTTMEAKAVW
ncbi:MULTISPECIES: MaoC family dehydratase N-terminal domain-containing protein [unclassified Chelatococcus]|uniref:FAS1-like dehydratase domain-containing protein n=1 Tax=unclassified Chelatococcus TaxID=2638111 RepID=UPI001BD09E99|nr:MULTISPECIES: MaoC family dehydratase N-terminal domain-containing protein [unclassified Chelatococcus]MBS7697649.1 MaoC family dehydratase N-terminal domain-containing protein [Chelatococcus sp. YT9]MBX3559023.1 MaoC family dehydratase N-terminal domain-containing protein [Chelatococcus sp.]